MNGDLLEENGIPRKLIENRGYRLPVPINGLLLRAGSYDSNFYEGKRLSPYSRYLFSRLIGDDLAYKLYDIMPKFKVDYPSGGIVGQCDLTGVLDWHEDAEWKVWEQYGLQLANIEPLPFAKVAGAIKLFFVPADIIEGIEV